MTASKKLILVIVPVMIFFAALFIGRFDMTPGEILRIICNIFYKGIDVPNETSRLVLLKIRLPRIVAALAVGGGLSVSGAAFQGVFRNPLVSPSLLGVASAAGFGAAIGILFSFSQVFVQLMAFAFGLMGVFITYALSRVYKRTPVLMLVLAGVVVSSLFSALISLMKYVADPQEKLPEIVFWLMGSLTDSSLRNLLFVLPGIILGTIPLLLLSWRVNILAMGDKHATSLGINVEFVKLVVIICCTVVTASAICLAGTVSWVGLVIPHVCRMLFGADNKYVFPASIVMGGAYLLLIDTVARSTTMGEIPLGILTAIVGAPFFGYLLRRTRGEAG